MALPVTMPSVLPMMRVERFDILLTSYPDMFVHLSFCSMQSC